MSCHSQAWCGLRRAMQISMQPSAADMHVTHHLLQWQIALAAPMSLQRSLQQRGQPKLRQDQLDQQSMHQQMTQTCRQHCS